MATSGFFIRGSISIGNLYIDETVVYGQGLVDAYKAETELARDPRIVLKESAANVVLKNTKRFGGAQQYSPFVSRIYKDSDGQLFLNYLDYRILIAECEIGPDYDELLKHKEAIENKLTYYQTKPFLWSKYAWVANYHNYFCSHHNDYFGDSCKIDMAKYQMQPSLITEE